MNNETVESNIPTQNRNIPPHRNKDVEFGGYTLEELRYQRALVMLQAEFCKEKVIVAAEKIKQRTPFTPEGEKGAIKQLGGLPGKIVKGLNFLDYLTIGFTLFTTFKKVSKLFNRKKKNH